LHAIPAAWCAAGPKHLSSLQSGYGFGSAPIRASMSRAT
jgi:hypothetical protein